MKPWEKYAQAAQPQQQAEGPWTRYQPQPREIGKLESLAAGASQGATLGFGDEIAGATAMIGKVPQGGFLGMPASQIRQAAETTPEQENVAYRAQQQEAKDAYKSRRDEVRDYLSQARDANPKTFLAGEMGGGIASGIATGGAGAGAGLGRSLAHAAAGGGVYATGASEGENAGEIAKDALTGAGVGALGGGVLYGGAAAMRGAANVGPVKSLRESVAGKLKDFANKRFAKSVVGQNRKLERELQRSGRYEQVGRTARDEGIISGSMGKNAQKMYRQVDDKLEDVLGPKYDAIYGRIDRDLGNFIDGDVIADQLLDLAAQQDVPGNDAAVNKIMNIAERLSGKRWSFDDARTMRQVFKYDPNADVSRQLGKMTTNKINMAIGDGMKDAVERSGFMSRAELQKLNTTFRDLKDIQKGLETLVSRYGNRTFGITDIGAGVAGATTTGSLKAGGAMALGSKFAKERGSQISAIGADKLSDVISGNPQMLGRFAPMLQKAAERGQSATGAAHYMLWQNEPEYRRMWEAGLATALDQ